jgi:hypothetical protein
MIKGEFNDSVISLACWNIDGVHERIGDSRVSKLEYPDIIDDLKQHDIICLTETHCKESDELYLPGYTCYLHNRQKAKKAWRASGGLAVFMKPKLKKGIKFVDKSCSEILWLCLNKEFFHHDCDIYIALVYISPINSSYTSKREDLFGMLEKSILKYSQVGECFVCGDFNGRTREEIDYVSQDSLKYIPCENVQYNVDLPVKRLNRDNHSVDSHGESLLSLCKSSGLRILNGRSLGDLRGNFTCYSPNGNPSVIDYMVCDKNLRKCINTFRVGPLGPFSIHCKTSTTIRVYNEVGRTVLKSVCKSESYSQERYQWRPENAFAFQRALESASVSEKIEGYMESKFTENNVGVQASTAAFTEIIKTAANKANVRKQGINKGVVKNKKKHAKWYDHSCLAALRNLKCLCRQLRMNPQDQGIRMSYNRCKKEYKHLLKKKNRQFHAILYNRLYDVERQNPKEFWAIFEELKGVVKNKNSISNVEWLNHFQKVMGKCNMDKNEMDYKINEFMCNDSGDIFNELSYSIKREEVQKVILKLKSRKSPGYDGIGNDMVKMFVHNAKLLDAMTKMLNIILRNGIFPDIWRYNTITPIHKKGDKNVPTNYRGIAVGVTMSKVFCSVLHNRLQKFVEENNIIPENQVGFRKGFRTVDHVLTLKTLIDKYVHKLKKSLYVAFVDFKSAYDSVWRKALF